MKLTFLSRWASRRTEPAAPSAALDFGPFPDNLYQVLSELGSLVTWKWVEKSDVVSTGGRRHIIIDVPLYRDDLPADEKSPFWRKEATCAFRIVFNPQGGGLVSGSRKVSRKELPSIQIIPACFKPHDGAPARWNTESHIYPQPAEVDAALRQVLQTVVQAFELNRNADAKAKLLALGNRAKPEAEQRTLRELPAPEAEPRRHVRRLYHAAEPALLEFRGPGLANVKAFKGWQARTDPATGQKAPRAVFSLLAAETYDLGDGQGARTTREFHCDEEFLDAVLRAEDTMEAFPDAYAQFERAWAARPGQGFERE